MYKARQNIKISSRFLFLEDLSIERLEWINQIFKENIKYSDLNNIKFFISGDAIYSLFEKDREKYWNEISKYPNVECIVDESELNLFGFDFEEIIKKFPENSLIINLKKQISNSYKNPLEFWNLFLKNTYSKKYDNKFGLFLFRGPYMSRNSVKALRLFEKCIENNINPELYTYLDGIHLGHAHQKPSAFENIGESLTNIKNNTLKKKLKFTMLSCSRCGTARGYIRTKNDEEYISSDDVISEYYFCNLNKIVDKFERNHLIYSATSGSIQYFYNNEEQMQNITNLRQPILIFMTHSPYSTEWTFGGISFAIACANHEIPTKVIFIENGIYSLIGTHNINEDDKVFNIQEIIEATFDMEFLDYYVYKDSLNKRTLNLNENLKKIINSVDNSHLSEIIFSIGEKLINHKKIIFF